MRTDTVTLGGKEYELRELPLKRNAEFRQRIKKQWEHLLPSITVAFNRDIESVGEMAALVGELAPVVVQAMGSADAVTNLVLEYMFDWRPDDDITSPEVAHILDNVYESEIFETFLKVASMVFPFYEWAKNSLTLLNNSMQDDGSQNGQTTMNLSEVNTDSGRKRKRGSTKLPQPS